MTPFGNPIKVDFRQARRAYSIEIYIVTPADFQVGGIATLDAIRQEISTAISDQRSYQWLIVEFTADERWI